MADQGGKHMKSYPRWVIDSGSLHTTVIASTAQQALVVAIQRCAPRRLGALVRFRKVCCARRSHAPHFVHLWLDPIPTLRRAGWLTRKAAR